MSNTSGGRKGQKNTKRAFLEEKSPAHSDRKKKFEGKRVRRATVEDRDQLGFCFEPGSKELGSTGKIKVEIG